MSKKNKGTRQAMDKVNNYIYVVRLLMKIAPERVFATIFRSFIHYFNWMFFSIVFVKYIFNGFANRTFQQSCIFIVASMLLFFTLTLYSSWYDQRYKIKSDQIIKYNIDKMIFDKAVNVDVECYENPEFYDDYTSSMTDASTKFINILDNTSNIICAFVVSIYILYAMISIRVVSVLFIIIPVVSSFVFNRLANKKRYEQYCANIVYERKKKYVDRTILQKKCAKDIRCSNILNVLCDTYQDGTEGIEGNIKKYSPQIFFYSYVRAFLSFPIAFESVWLYSAYCAIVAKNITMGEYIILANAIVNITNMLLGLVNGIIDVSQNSLYVDKFREFMSYEAHIDGVKGGIHVSKGSHVIELKDVCFKYKNQDHYILNHINMKLKTDEIIALVGLNGAGKTTLIKLIMRLYDVDGGEILLDGINITEYNIVEYRELFSTVFQEPQLFAMSVAENILMREIAVENDYYICEKALEEVGLYDKVNALEKKMNTSVTKEFDDRGVVFSGGQEQKLALARAYAKNSPVMILDEPSSALDAFAEYDLHKSLVKLCSDKIYGRLIIIISHRMSFANVADRVYVINNGCVVEEGTHFELMNQKGLYADLYEKQSRDYKNAMNLAYES